MDKLTQVSMTRGGVTQLRTFVYNADGQLTSVTQPENGTTSYTYDVYGRPWTKTDAKGNVETYSFDGHGRRTSVYRKPAGWATNDLSQTTLITWDTAVNGWGRVASVIQGEGRTVESYEYTVGGLVTKKRLGFQDYDTTLEAVYSWNQAGQMTSMKYPDVYSADGTVAATGRTLNYSYSYLGPPAAMKDPALPWGYQTVASGVWNGAGQMTQLSVRKPDATMDVENFTYNDRGQLLQQSGRGVNIEYRYSATANDGRLASRKDNISGEEVTYQYDLLGRLASAETTGSGGWGLSWSYDGFGNRLTQSVTKGTAPVVSLTVNAATNRISSSGFVYDANGNQTQWPVGAGTASASYDMQNRMTSVATANGGEGYAYSAANQRVLIARSGGTETLFYGLGGELLGVYARTQKANGRYYVSSVIGTRVWFAGRMIESSGNAVVRDRLGSVEKNGSTLTRYYPYGEEQGGATAGNKEKFGTYTRDAVSGLDYAWNRYYSSTWGRFTSADPYQASGGATDPQSWNRYSYVENDPITFHDPGGLQLRRVGCVYSGFSMPGGAIDTSTNCPPGYIEDWMEASYLLGGGGGGGGGNVAPSPFISLETWKTNPGLAVREWDLLIAATISQATANPDVRYPMYLNVRDECVTTNGLTGALQLQRHYELKDQHGRDMPGGTFTEFNAVVAGTMTSGNATFMGNDWDYISAGRQEQYNFYQTFVGRSGTGIGPVPIFVRDHGVDYGTLAVEATMTSIKINGVDKSNLRRCP